MSDQGIAGRNILVPLDGSELAEQALPAAARIAEALHGRLVLARVTSPTLAVVNTVGRQEPVEAGERRADDEAQLAEEYLTGMAWPLIASGVSVQTVTVHGDPGDILLELLATLRIGLVVMTTHGRTGMARVAVGSVADHLVRGSHVPVLLLRPLLEGRCGDQLDRAIIPLDGSQRAEAALDVADALAGALLRNITVLQVVPPHDGRVTQREMEAAERYLDTIGKDLGHQLGGRAAVETQVLGGDPAEAIIRRAAEYCDLVIMATHGATGARRMMLGSVADRVLHDSGAPLMLICPE